MVRAFLQSIKGGAQVAMDALFQEVDNQETATTTQDELYRKELLGYSGKEGVFQRDDLIKKFTNFCKNRNALT